MIGALTRFLDGDVWHSFTRSPAAMASAAVAFICVFCASFAGLVAPHDPTDLATLELADALMPPAWLPEGRAEYVLGTDAQGRDILSALMYGTRISLMVGVASVIVSMVIGVALGLVAGFVGGRIDAFLMRVCDVMLSFPSSSWLLVAGGGARHVSGRAHKLAFAVLIVAISLTGGCNTRHVRGPRCRRNKELCRPRG